MMALPPGFWELLSLPPALGRLYHSLSLRPVTQGTAPGPGGLCRLLRTCCSKQGSQWPATETQCKLVSAKPCSWKPGEDRLHAVWVRALTSGRESWPLPWPDLESLSTQRQLWLCPLLLPVPRTHPGKNQGWPGSCCTHILQLCEVPGLIPTPGGGWGVAAPQLFALRNHAGLRRAVVKGRQAGQCSPLGWVPGFSSFDR